MRDSDPSMRQLLESVSKAAALLKTIGNEHRLLVLCVLIQHEELSVNALQDFVPLSQSALSQHLAKMRQEGLITYRREAQTLYYRILNEDVKTVISTLKTIFCP
ncbi:MAG: metalloregulator ArsR/SmtB family transcription factor [Pigmentiphaga sp.]|nr:metalloregulator ArsR/SmtB family transcription factor [Pigmentiphaga sp.]